MMQNQQFGAETKIGARLPPGTEAHGGGRSERQATEGAESDSAPRQLFRRCLVRTQWTLEDLRTTSCIRP